MITVNLAMHGEGMVAVLADIPDDMRFNREYMQDVVTKLLREHAYKVRICGYTTNGQIELMTFMYGTQFAEDALRYADAHIGYVEEVMTRSVAY